MTNKLHTSFTTIFRNEANFDRACDEARDWALMNYRIDDYGHSNVIPFDRSCDVVCIEFVGYKLRGLTHYYNFNVWIEHSYEEDEDQ